MISKIDNSSCKIVWFWRLSLWYKYWMDLIFILDDYVCLCIKFKKVRVGEVVLNKIVGESFFRFYVYSELLSESCFVSSI